MAVEKEEKLATNEPKESFWPQDWPKGWSQTILINSSEVMTVKDALIAINFYDHDKKSKNINSEKQLDLATRASKILSVAKKCKYSSLIVNVLRTYFESISSYQKLILENSIKNEKILKKPQIALNEIVKSTIDLKKIIVKLIFKTDEMMKSSLNLKSTDHTFFKSLLAIHLCLYTIQIYSNQNKEDVTGINLNIDIKRLFAQMLNLIERFRCKYCSVEYYFESYLVIQNEVSEAIRKESLTELIYKTLNTLQVYREDFSVAKNHPNYGVTYNENMYDPKYMLLEHIFNMSDYSFIPTLLVRWKNTTNWTELKHVYTEVSKSLDLRIIYDYQVFVIELIKEIFFIKLLNTKIQPFNDIKNIVEAFEVFIDKMVPNNYPTHLYVPIKDVLSSLYSDIRSTSTESHPILSDRSIKLLRNISIIMTLSTSCNLDETVKKLSMKDFIQQVITGFEYKIFVEMFEELSYESYTLDDYDFYQLNSFGVNQIAINENMCNDLSLIRYNLFLFQMLILRFQHTNIDKSVLDPSVQKAKKYVMDNIMYLYRTYGSYDKIKQIVLPLMVSFKYTSNQIGDYKTLYQMSVLNLNLLEHFELIVCPSPGYNLDMFYDKIKDSTVLKLLPIYQNENFNVYQRRYWQNKENITETIKLNTKDHRMRDVDSMIIDDFILYVDLEYLGSDPKSTLSLWDGSMESVSSVSLALPQSIIDHQHLVRHQCFVMKWIISKIVMNVLKCILVYDSAESNDTGNHNMITTVNQLTQFEEQPFPKSVKQYLRDIFDAFHSLFRDVTEETKEKYKSIVIKNLDSFQTSLEDLSFILSKDQEDVSSINVLIKKDMIFLKIILNSINDSKIISDVPFSSCIYV